MKTRFVHFSILVTALLVLGCQVFTMDINLSGEGIKPSQTIISETRPVQDFTAIDMRAVGKVVITQGEGESLSIQGSDNILPIIETSVENGVLVIQTREKIDITGLHDETVLIFTIGVKDLSSLVISGAADVEMGSLSTSALEIVMSGAGQFVVEQLNADSIDILLSGVGNVEVSGEVIRAEINISGTGSIHASDLKIQTCEVDLSGLGGATLWVTDQLSGLISGGGTISYYGNPQTDTETTGIGEFKALGNK